MCILVKMIKYMVSNLGIGKAKMPIIFYPVFQLGSRCYNIMFQMTPGDIRETKYLQRGLNWFGLGVRLVAAALMLILYKDVQTLCTTLYARGHVPLYHAICMRLFSIMIPNL